MRPLEIEITVFDKKHAEVVGDNDHSTDQIRKCTIDLDRVESVWEDPPKQGGDGILIKLYSGDSFWTKSFTKIQFVSLWNNEAGYSTSATKGQPYPLSIEPGSIEPCVVCGSKDIFQKNGEFECNSCGFKWTTSNISRFGC